MSKSDDEKNKLQYEQIIDDCLKIADEHEKYCNLNCFINNTSRWYPHKLACIEFRKRHYESFVECNSIFCLTMNESLHLKPSYLKKKDNVKVITELTYYSDSD